MIEQTESEIAIECAIRGTSTEIWRAILSVADDMDEASCIWALPTFGEARQVMTKAWQLADPNEDTLFWGDAEYHHSDVF